MFCAVIIHKIYKIITNYVLSRTICNHKRKTNSFFLYFKLKEVYMNWYFYQLQYAIQEHITFLLLEYIIDWNLRLSQFFLMGSNN